MQFKDKVVAITGGAHGIGKTTKEAFAKYVIDKHAKGGIAALTHALTVE